MSWEKILKFGSIKMSDRQILVIVKNVFLKAKDDVAKELLLDEYGKDIIPFINLYLQLREEEPKESYGTVIPDGAKDSPYRRRV